MSNYPQQCPHCGTSWVADEIPVHIRHHYGGRTHFWRTIGIYDILLDGNIAYACPDCESVFERWTHQRIPGAVLANF